MRTADNISTNIHSCIKLTKFSLQACPSFKKQHQNQNKTPKQQKPDQTK